MKLASSIARRSTGTIVGSCDSWAEAKGGYRLLNRESVTEKSVSWMHYRRVEQELRQPGHFLLIEDTTALAFHSLDDCEDLGPIGEAFTRGILVHSTLAVRIDESDGCGERLMAEPIGLLHQRMWTREQSPGGGRTSVSPDGPRSPESARWASALTATAAPPSGTRWTFVADRESDIYEVFGRCRAVGAGFVIRACQPRRLKEELGSVLELVSTTARRDTQSVDVPSRDGGRTRRATLELRTISGTLRPPRGRGRDIEPVPVNVVEVRETARGRTTPIRWVLLTDQPVDAIEQAWAIVGIYRCRWLIEEFHKAIKTGMGVENSQLSSARRLKALAAVLSIVATRLLRVKMLSRSRPDELVPDGVIDSRIIRLIEASVDPKKLKPWTYRRLIRVIAMIGGFPGRKGDGEPGWLTIWRGWQRLSTPLGLASALSRSG